MKQVINRWLLLFVLLLGMSALACNLPFGGEPEPTPRPTTDDDDDGDSSNAETAAAEETVVEEESAAEQSDTETSEADEDMAEEAVEEETAVSEESDDGGLFSGLFAESVEVSKAVQEFEALDSYQMQMEISTTYSETTQVIQMTMSISTDPKQSQMTVSFAGLEEATGMESITMTQIEGTNYMILPEFGCITTSEEELVEGTFAGTMDASDFLEDVGEASLVGEETINGVETLHYTFDETVIEGEMTQFNWAQGDVYIAQEGNYVVRFRLEGEGSVSDFALSLDQGEPMLNEAVGMIVIEMNLTSINEPVNIAIPEECENSGTAAADYPVLEDASEYSSFGSFFTYKTETAFADIVTFYQENLAAAGWTYLEGESLILEGSTALMYFDQGDQSLTVTVTEEGGSSAFIVMVLEE